MAGILLPWGLLHLAPGSCTPAPTTASLGVPSATSPAPGTPSRGRTTWSPTSSSDGISTTSSSTYDIPSVTTTSSSNISTVTTPSSTTSDTSAVTTNLSNIYGDQSTITCTGDGACMSAAAVAGSVIAAVVLTSFLSSTLTFLIIRGKCSGQLGDERTLEPCGGRTIHTLQAGTQCPDKLAPVYIGGDMAGDGVRLHTCDSEIRKSALDDIPVIDLDHSERLVFAYNPLTMAEESMEESAQTEL